MATNDYYIYIQRNRMCQNMPIIKIGWVLIINIIVKLLWVSWPQWTKQKVMSTYLFMRNNIILAS